MSKSAKGTGRADKKLSDYGQQLLEKQRLRAYYGVMEKQFVTYVRMAKKSSDLTGHALVKILESRLDNLVYRMGFASSIRQARQMVVHGHFFVNGKKIDIPSYLCEVGDAITLKEKSREVEMFKENFQSAMLNTLPYIDKDEDNFTARYIKVPERKEVPIEIEDQLVVEYYSKTM